jgi:nitroreductase
MDVLEAIRGRRNVRAFTSKDASNSMVKTLIDAAMWAPSAGNIQPREYIIVRKPETKRELAEAALDQAFVEETPLVVVVCADENRSSSRYGTRGKTLYCIQDTAASTQNTQLAACSLGLASC